MFKEHVLHVYRLTLIACATLSGSRVRDAGDAEDTRDAKDAEEARRQGREMLRTCRKCRYGDLAASSQNVAEAADFAKQDSTLARFCISSLIRRSVW